MDIKTITSTEGVNEADFGSNASRFYWFQNIGTTTVHVSANADITAGADGVAELAAGDSVCIETLGGKVYVLGAGKVQIHNTGDKFCPFKIAPAAGGGEAVDAYTKTESDDKYAQKTDVVPYKLGMDFGTCSTAAATISKVATTLNKVAPSKGAVFAIKFTNSVPAQARLKVNNLSGYLHYRGSSISAGIINAGDIVTFMYYVSSGLNIFEIISIENGGNAKTVNGFTVGCDVPENAVFTDTVPDLSGYASKELYGDTTINVGRKADSTVGEYSTAEGYETTASGTYSHAEGVRSVAEGQCSHAEGYHTYAGQYAHAESQGIANGWGSHAEGSGTANGELSHVSGFDTVANNKYEAAYGAYNVSNEDTLFSFGDGTSDNTRHNAFEITKTGGRLHDKEISTTPIKSTSISGTTNAYGALLWESANAGKIPLFVDVESKLCVPFRSVNNYWIYMTYQTVADFGKPVANTVVSGTIYYVEV